MKEFVLLKWAENYFDCFIYNELEYEDLYLKISSIESISRCKFNKGDTEKKLCRVITSSNEHFIVNCNMSYLKAVIDNYYV